MGQESQSRPAPAGATPINSISSLAALRLPRGPQLIPTADAVGYRSFAAPRLWLVPLKTPNLFRPFLKSVLLNLHLVPLFVYLVLYAIAGRRQVLLNSIG